MNISACSKGQVREHLTDLKHTLLGMALILALMVAGCGGGGGSGAGAPDPTGTTSETGQLIIGVTDAPGDFVMYEVAATALTLTRSNGDVVSALPLATRIDFAELTEVTELLSIATVPAGNYDSVTLTLDFSDAEILVQDEAGDAVAADVVDADGNAMGEIEMRLNLTTTDQIRIAPGRPAAFSLDFDLDASNEIDLTSAPPVVTVEPFLLATPELETDRTHRVRGVLAAVEDASFELAVRPFRQRDRDFGEFTVEVDSDTIYEVDGEGFTGAEGLSAMALLDLRAPVMTVGRIETDGEDRSFVAEEVLAGSSVPWTDADVVKGVVVARTGEVLTVRGAIIEFADGGRAFRGEFEVQMDAETVVTAPSSGLGDVSIASVSVGQRVTAWGEFLDDRTLGADRIRMGLSQLTAEVVEASPLAVDLYFLNGRNPEIYDFSGTGVSADQDANPDLYDIESSLLPLDNLEAGDLIRVRGLVNEFGLAPPDFLGRTIIDVATDFRAATLWVGWDGGTSVPFTAIAPDRIDVDLIEARKALKMRGVPRGFIDLLDSVALTAPEDGMGVYAVKVRGAGEVHLYRGFADLVDALTEQLDQGRALHRITAQGRYNTSVSELTTGRAGFVFSVEQSDG